jgi:1,2-diacylglycerol 3-alpha-glucosyltransferase
MRIGLFTDAYYPIISGVSISVDILVKEFTKLGHEVIVITNDHDDAQITDHVVRVKGVRLPMKGLREYRIGKVTRKKVREIGNLNLDIVHCHTEFTMGRLGRKTARKNHIPVVHTYHTMYEDYVHFVSKAFSFPLRVISKWYSRSFAKSADEVIFPTIKVKNTFDKYGFKGSSHIIPTGIYIDRFRKLNFHQNDLDNLKQKLGFNKDDFIALFLGRMSREKSIEDLIKHFHKISKKHNDIKLLFVGGGPDIPLFKKEIENFNLSDKVVFTGMVSPEDTPKYYQIADLFINFSVTETQGLTYYEALASSTPLLVKYDDNLEDIIIQGKNGYAFNDDNDFDRYFDMIKNDENKLNNMKKHAAETVQRFSASNYARSIEKIYKKLLEKEG